MILHDKGRLFVTTLPIKTGVWPVMAGMWAKMDEPPWRSGRGIAVRVGRETALAFGVWGRGRDIAEVDGILAAMTPPRAWRRGSVARKVGAWADLVRERDRSDLL